MIKNIEQNPIKVSLLKNEDVISKSRYFVLLIQGSSFNALYKLRIFTLLE